jgi:preprotein translocase subunit SecD
VDQFGVAEPLIQREGEDRIAVQLPGLTDRQRAIELIGKTALLEFKLLRTPEEVKGVFDRLDSYLAARGAGAAVGVDTALRRTPLTSQFLGLEGAAFVRNEDLPKVDGLLAVPGVDSILPSDSQLLWGPSDEAAQGVTGRTLYLVKREAELTGGSVASADAQVGLDQTNPGAWGVSMKMTPKGRADFARVTGNNVGRRLAIVLDGIVNSAPSIRERIPSGDASAASTSRPPKTWRSCCGPAPSRPRSTSSRSARSGRRSVPTRSARASPPAGSAPCWWCCSWRSTTSCPG